MAEEKERAIVVSGEATLRRVPDLAVTSLAVTIRDKRLEAARDAANRRASAILARLKELGLPESDVQAASLTVQPTYDYARGRTKITGYEASRPMTIRVRDLSLLGTILDDLVDEGATQVHHTSMELAEPEAISREALAAALVAARGRAEALATAAGVKLGQPLRVEEEAGGMPIPVRAMARMEVGAMDSAPTEIAAGEVEISARVRASFAIS